MTSFVEKRQRPRNRAQRCAYWTRRILRIGVFCVVSGVFLASAVTAGHQAIKPKAQQKK